jgi:para-nitrobenzyl esterase
VLTRRTTDAVYRTAARRFVRLLAAAGARVQSAEFDGHPDGGRLGSAHAMEVALLFPSEAWADMPLLAPAGGRSLVAAGAPLRAAWAEFARAGRVSATEVPTGAGWSGRLRLRSAR